MSLKDKLEIGLKPDAPYRPDNLPDFQKDDPSCKVAATPGDAEAVRRAREECAEMPVTRRPRRVRRAVRRTARRSARSRS